MGATSPCDTIAAMGLLFKHWSSQERLALIVRVILYAQLLTCLFQCVLGVFEARREEFVREFGRESYVATSHNLYAVRHALSWYFDLAAFGSPIAIFACLGYGVLVLHISRKQAFFYVALIFL